MRGGWLLPIAIGACSAGAPARPPATRHLTVIAVAEVRGTPEPCGCTSDPLGDVSRVAGLLDEAAKRGGALLVDAGGLRYGVDPIKPEARAQADLKADFLERAWKGLGAQVGLGDEDLRFGTKGLGGRLVANAAGVPGTERSRIVETGGIKVGLFGLVDPEGIQVAGVTVEDPVAAAQREAQALRGKGAELVVALAHLKRPAARKVAHAIGEGIVIAGDEVGDDGGAPEQVGGAIVIAPADQAQRAARIELTVAGAPSLQLVESPAQRAQALAKAKDKLAQARALIEKLAKDPKADPDFLATQRALAAKLDGERAALEQPQAAPPASYAVAELVPIKRRLARDPKVQQAMKELDRAVGEANRKAGEAHPVPPPGKGEPRYVGIEECELCHQPAVDFWKKTVHARAWQELVAVDKQWSFDCIGCHVTGYGQPGGSAVAHVDKLTDVQCEVCHGPASLHAAKPKKVHLAMPDEGRCKDCHTKDHSDTFQFTAYLRDVLGPGHGAKRREKLGDGPTGQALRKAALEKAKGE